MQNKVITASAPGKIHLIGEYTAVYFKPAILASINKRCTADLIPTKENTIKITTKNFDTSVNYTSDEILDFTDNANKEWERYRKQNEVAVLKSIITHPTDYPVLAIGETLKFFRVLKPAGFHLTIDSELPIGSGLGSSAAISATIVAAVTKFLGHDIDMATLRSIAIKAEQKMHGNPTYGDISAVTSGGLMWFCKENTKKITIRPLSFTFPKKLSKNMLLLQSGVPEETTGEMVHNVEEFRKKQPESLDLVLQDQEQLTFHLLDVIKQANEEEFMNILRKAEKNLEKIGVVSKSTKNVIREIEKAGGAAKICGAGGRKKGSGIILAFHKDKKVIESLAKDMKLAYYAVELGGKGLEIQ